MGDQENKITPPGATKRIEPSTEMMARLKEKQEVQQRKPVQEESPVPDKADIGIKIEAGFPVPQMPVLFKALLISSYFFLVVGVVIGVVAALDIKVPGFIMPVVNFVGKFFIRPA